mgnify:FL=1
MNIRTKIVIAMTAAAASTPAIILLATKLSRKVTEDDAVNGTFEAVPAEFAGTHFKKTAN